jgi:peptide chain release factor 2
LAIILAFSPIGTGEILMQAETTAKIEIIVTAIGLLRQHVKYDAAKDRLAVLEEAIGAADFWNDQANAQETMREKNRLERQLAAIDELQNEMDDAVGLIELGEAEGDTEIIQEAEASLASLVTIAEKRQLESLLSGEADGNDCFIEVHAGAGGTEAQDWALMLMRMYSRWCDARGFRLEIIEESAGEEAGIKSVTMRVEGENAYGWMKTESGVHRLVRISPYDSSARRHTSFASVWVYPVVDDNIEIEIEDKDLRIDTYRASGAGGQHVNKTDSAIRITHLPTNIVVQCQNDRSQHRNRATAFNMLKARLYELELQRREDEANDAASAKTEIGWGNQIRSYVLHPYQMVKDLRTNVEKGNAQGVLDGDLDDFIEASLAARVGNQR